MKILMTSLAAGLLSLLFGWFILGNGAPVWAVYVAAIIIGSLVGWFA